MAPTLKAPVVVNLGKSNRKRIKKLKRGEGKLMGKLQNELAQMKGTGRIPADAEAIVFVVERRSAFSRRSAMSMPRLPMPKCFS